jgi:hypothetical protein
MGFAGTCKLTAAQMPLIAAVLVAWISWRSRRPPAVILRRAALFGVIALIPCVPWYVHSYLWSGNPFYPFAVSIFGDNPDHALVWSILNYYGGGRSLKDMLLAPWRLYVKGVLFDSGQYLSPIPFIVAPIIFLRLKGSRDRQTLAAALGLSFVFWLSSAHLARYLVPIQPILAVLAAEGLCWMAAGNRYRLRLAILIATLFIGFGTVSTIVYQRKFVSVVIGRESTDAYLARNSWFYLAYRRVVADVPENGRVLTNQGPTYYLDRPHVRVRDAELSLGPERLQSLLSGNQFTHIMVHGNAGLESLVAARGPRVKLLWRDEFDLPVSRTFGNTFKLPAALFEVIRR